MSRSNERIEQTIRFLKWTKKYSGFWQLICEQGNEHMSPEKMQMLIKELSKEEFFEMIFVLLEVHKNEDFMKSLQETMLKDLIISEWKKGNGYEIINKLIMHLD